MNLPVNFEIAKLLKEKEFNLKVRYSYGHSINPHIAYPNEDFAISCDFNSSNMGRNWKHLYSAPTIAKVINWLYEKHGIWISVDWLLETEDKWHYLLTRKLKNSVWVSDGNPLYNSPTEAYEAAIKYTLKNLV